MKTALTFILVIVFTFLGLLSALAGNNKDTFSVRRTLHEVPIKAETITIDGIAASKIQTAHYEITCRNAEYGTDAAVQLEHLHAFWIATLSETKTEKQIPAVRKTVIIFRNKNDYNEKLTAQIGASFVVNSNGYYSPQKNTFYFYPQKETDKQVSAAEKKVLFHEGTHQILTEYFREKPAAQPLTREMPNNFWIVEGTALFMETFRIEEKEYLAGDIRDNRLYAAKVYHFERNFRLPIKNLTAMKAKQIQTSPDIVKIYDQSAALFYLLMFAEEGKYRKPLRELLRQTYQGTAKPEALSALTGLSFADIDKKYAEFLKTVPEE